MSTHEDKTVDLKGAKDILDRMIDPYRQENGIARNDLIIPLLQEIQGAYGYLPQEVLHWVSGQSGIALSRMYGVITFYAQFHTEPHGKHTVSCCRGTACHIRGGKKVINTVQSSLGIEPGETSEDMQFSLETVACLGACALAPVMVVDESYHGKMTPRRAQDILSSFQQEEE